MTENREKIVTMLTVLSEGNPGALNVLMTLFKHDNEQEITQAFDSIVKHAITGPELWLLYKDENNQDIKATVSDLIDESAISKLRKNRYSRFYTE